MRPETEIRNHADTGNSTQKIKETVESLSPIRRPSI
jgi:hypothetical protein